MTNISCERGIKLADYMPSDQRSKSSAYTGGAGRLATTYDKKYRPVPEEDRGQCDELLIPNLGQEIKWDELLIPNVGQEI